MARFFAFVLALIVLAAVPARANPLAVVAPSTKICQLTGDVDWGSNTPTAAQTLTNFGQDAVDLGFPVDAGESSDLYFLFGDTWPTLHPPSNVPPDYSLGFTTRTTSPDPATCLNLQLVTQAPKMFAYPTVTPPIEQGSFDVPTGGIFVDGSLYAFFWTNHCTGATPLAANSTTPLVRPTPSSACPETNDNNSIGNSVLAMAAPVNPVAFTRSPIEKPAILLLPYQNMPSGFVYVTAAQPPLARFIPKYIEPEIPVFGAPRYRASIPYLAMAPRATFGNPATWKFFGGMSGSNPVWLTRAQWEANHDSSGNWLAPAGAELYAAIPAERCVGEHSVTWNAPLHVWIMLYNCGFWSIQARSAPEPWGPWSVPTEILGYPADAWTVCAIIMSNTACQGMTRRNYWPGMAGFFYAPYVMNRYTQDATPPGGPAQTTIYWLLSTWNPYQVIVMQTTLELGSNFIIRRPFIPQPILRNPLPPVETLPPTRVPGPQLERSSH